MFISLNLPYLKGHFTHKPRAVTMKLWEPKRKCPKAVPTHLQNHVVWSQTLKCSVKPYVTGPSTNCYFNEFPFLTHFKNRIKPTDVRRSECHGLPVVFCSTYLQEVVVEKSPSDHETTIHLMPRNIPRRLYIHLAFTHSVGPSSLVWSLNLDRLRLSHQWECLRCNGHGHGHSVSCVEWP